MSDDHDIHAPLPQEQQIAPILAARAPAVPRKRPAAPSPLSGILANLPQISPAAGTKRRAPAVAAATAGSVAMAIAAAEESNHDPQNIDDDTELQQVLAENARLRQHIHHASVNGPGFFLDQDYPQDDNYGAVATTTGQRMGTTLLPQAAQSAYAGPPPTYVYQGAPIGAIFQSAPTGGRVQAKTTPLITPSGGLGAEYYGTHASQAQGQQLTTLLTSHSYTAYSKSHPDDARTLSTMLNVRDNLCVAQHNGALALGGLQDPSTPLYAPLMDSIQSIELCIPATKEVVNQLSQRMLFAGRDIGPEAM